MVAGQSLKAHGFLCARLLNIAQLYKAGDLVDEMLQAYPHLNPAAIYDAIRYYLDHQAEIEQEISQNRLEALVAKHNLTLGERGFVRFDTVQMMRL